ncbi:MAG: RluA family pseudouridine synthase [Andreesenia angusta]|nr:RluA family pseudouridine synthase [Andreesenia angusta]
MMDYNFTDDENTVSFKVNEDYENLEKYLKKEYEISSRMIKRMVREKSIYLNGKKVKRNVEIKKGDIITLLMQEEQDETLPDPDVKLDIVYEDNDLLVLNKQPFRVVHTTRNHQMGTIANGVVDYFIREGIKKRVRFINRLDRDTSGILLIGKNSFAHQQISKQFEADTVVKNYMTLVKGVVLKDSDTIDLPIEREDEENSIIRIVRADGKRAITHYQVIKRFKNASLLKVRLETGRTHQIRVHLKYIGHPIIGDSLYYKESPFIKRQALHSYSMEIDRPRTKERILLEAELPKDMKELIKKLENN